MEQSEADLVAAVRDLARTRFSARAERIDREGIFPAENMRELQALGIPGMALAKDLGGLGVSAATQMRIMEEIAYGDGSTAVALNMHVLIAGFLEFMPPFPRRNAVLADIGRNGTMICGPGSVPTGEVDNRKAGYRVRDEGDYLVINGQAGFASNSEGAKYTIFGGCAQRSGGRVSRSDDLIGSSSSPAGESPVRVTARRPGSRLAAWSGNGPGRSPASKALSGEATERSVASKRSLPRC